MSEPGEILIPESKIRDRVVSMGKEISSDYSGQLPVLVAVLKGAVFFLTDLAKHISIPCMFDFMAISRYKGRGHLDGVVKITRDIGIDITGRPVILIEDIIDTGLTVAYLKKVILTRKPESLEICTLLNRKARRIADVNIKYWGFELPDVYVVGYGLDHQGLYRNLQDIYKLGDSDNSFRAATAPKT